MSWFGVLTSIARLTCFHETHRNLEVFNRLGNISLDVTTYQWSFPAFAQVARQFPNVTFIACHMGGPPVNILKNKQEWDIWLSGMKQLASVRNIYVKLSCLMPVIGSDFHLRRVKPYIQAGVEADELAASGFGTMIRETLKLFGPQRCMWASNYPSDKTSARYGELLACTWIVMKEMGIDKAGRRAVVKDTAVKAYKLELPSKPLKGDSKGVQKPVAKL